jgi:hypothetical protein
MLGKASGMQKETNGLFPHHLNGEEKLLGLHLEVH